MPTTIGETTVFTLEAEFLDVIGTKVTSTLIGLTPPPPPSKSGLKLVCNVNVVYRNLKSENSQETSTILYIYEFGFRYHSPGSYIARSMANLSFPPLSLSYFCDGGSIHIRW
jgi:hypothetical protein